MWECAFEFLAFPRVPQKTRTSEKFFPSQTKYYNSIFDCTQNTISFTFRLFSKYLNLVWNYFQIMIKKRQQHFWIPAPAVLRCSVLGYFLGHRHYSAGRPVFELDARLLFHPYHSQFIFFLSFNLLICWQLFIWNCCKPYFSLLYNCQLLFFWRLALSSVVEVFPRPFFRLLLLQGCLLQTRYAKLYALSLSGVYFFKF